jgi:2-C-methyl-D-erythritol 4-phosphate cytidylyltransferase
VTVWTVVVAGGSGTRFGGPKSDAVLNGRRVVDRSVAVAAQVSDGVVLVVPADGSLAPAEGCVVVAGGSTRSQSVRNGLGAVPAEAAIVVVHDAARPLATPALYERVIGAVRSGADGAIPGVAVVDTIKRVDDGLVAETVDRSALVAVQTPQAFSARTLRAAHASGLEATDDAGLLEAMGGRVAVVEGESTNRKLTTREDLAVMELHAAALDGVERFGAHQ